MVALYQTHGAKGLDRAAVLRGWHLNRQADRYEEIARAVRHAASERNAAGNLGSLLKAGLAKITPAQPEEKKDNG